MLFGTINEEQIQILHLSQVTIRNNIEALCHDTDWGAPFFYDIKIIKKGEGTGTEYVFNPLPHKPLASYIIEFFNKRPCYLEAIFDTADLSLLKGIKINIPKVYSIKFPVKITI